MHILLSGLVFLLILLPANAAINQESLIFSSGGQIFLIKGKGFDLIQKPKMKFTVYPERKMKHVSYLLWTWVNFSLLIP